MTQPAESSTSRPTDVRVYVNERGVSVPRGSTALDAVRAFSSAQGDEVEAGAARLTDSRGLPIDPSCPVSGGLILRVLPVRARIGNERADDAA